MAKNKYFIYEPRQRKILGNEKWIATLKKEEMCSTKEIAEEIAYRTTIGAGEIEGFLIALLEEVKYHLMAGDGVKINKIGTFYPRVICKTVDDVKDASLKNCVKSITAGFRAESQLRESVKEAKMKKFDLTEYINPKENR